MTTHTGGPPTAEEYEALGFDASARHPDVLRAEAEELEARAKGLRESAEYVERKALAARPLLSRLVFAATARCACGAGMAYDPTSEGVPGSPFKGPSQWECSNILRFRELSAEEQAVAKAATHEAPLPFAFYEIKSERQPSQGGATTRPGGVAKDVYGAA
jgi:hypothetical protein